MSETSVPSVVSCEPSVVSVPPREVSICAICRDDISTNLGRRRLLFHLYDSSRPDPTSQTVKQVHDLMSLFANGIDGRHCDLSNCSQDYIESMASKWCCRKCERMVDNIYKRFQQLHQFYNQYRDSPLAQLLHSLAIDRNSSTDELKTADDSGRQSGDQSITINELIIQESVEQNVFDSNEIEIIPINNNESQESEKLDKKRKPTEEEVPPEAQEIESKVEDCPVEVNQRKTRSKTSTECEKSGTKSQINKRLKTAKTENNSTKPENELKSKLSLGSIECEIDKQILTSLTNHYYEGIMRALLSVDKLKTIAIREVARHVSAECMNASRTVAKQSHSLETLKLSELKKLIHQCLPSTLLLFTVLTGKEKLLNAPIVSMISILMYVLNSHANLFQKMIATVLLHSKCNPSTIERLHTYKLCIAYETLVL